MLGIPGAKYCRCGNGLYSYNPVRRHKSFGSRFLCSSYSNSMASFCCSIETEPKTLSQGQLSHAREVAVDIVQKRESIEASEIFVEGMGMAPIIGIKEMARTVEMRDSICNHDAQSKIFNQTVCQCSLVTSASLLDTPDQARPKEPLSAPF